MAIHDKTHHQHKMLKVTNSPNTIQPNYYLSVASVDSNTTESTCIFLETLNKTQKRMCGKNKQENKKTTNMQTNSPPKLDTTKHTCILN